MKASSLRRAESQHQQRVIELAHLCQYKVAHFRKVRVQRGNGSTYWETPAAVDGKGFPDLTLAGDRVIFIELKVEGRKLEPEQKEWLRALIKAGSEAYVIREDDIDDLAAILRQRGSVWTTVAWDAQQRLAERTRQELT